MEATLRCTLSACLCTLPVIAVAGWYVWRNGLSGPLRLDYLTVIIFYPFAPFIKRRD